MKVYVVTEGCYSEYHILMVFKDREKAKLYVDTYNKTRYSYGANIEVWHTADNNIVGMDDYVYYTFSGSVDEEIHKKYDNGAYYFHSVKSVEFLDDKDLAQCNVFYELNEALEIHRKFPKGTDEEFVKKKLEKIFQDIRAVVLQMLADGATVEDINEAIGGIREDE